MGWLCTLFLTQALNIQRTTTPTAVSAMDEVSRAASPAPVPDGPQRGRGQGTLCKTDRGGAPSTARRGRGTATATRTTRGRGTQTTTAMPVRERDTRRVEDHIEVNIADLPVREHDSQRVEDLIDYADVPDAESRRRTRALPTTPSTRVGEVEAQRLVSAASQRKRHRIAWFNTPDGKRLRLDVQSHLPTTTGTPKWCALCGVYKKGWRGHKSSFKCSSCSVHLCVRESGPDISSCWKCWHQDGSLSARVLQQPSSGHLGQRAPRKVEQSPNDTGDAGERSNTGNAGKAGEAGHSGDTADTTDQAGTEVPAKDESDVGAPGKS